MPKSMIMAADAAEMQERLQKAGRQMGAAKVYADFRQREAEANLPGEAIMVKTGEGQDARFVPCRLIAEGLVLDPNGQARNPFKVRMNKKERIRERRANHEKWLKQYFGRDDLKIPTGNHDRRAGMTHAALHQIVRDTIK